MKSSISVFILTICLTLSANSQNGGTGKRKTDREERDLIGPVRDVKIEREVLEKTGDGYCCDGWVPSYITFDRFGNIDEDIEYDNDGKVQGRYISETDRAGNKIKEIYFDPDGKIKFTLQMEYDKDGNQIEVKEIEADGTVGTWTRYFFDKKGNMDSTTSLDPHGAIISTFDTTYDSQGRVLTDNPQGSDEKLYRTEYSYSFEKGSKKEESRSFDYQGVLQYRYVVLVDKNGDETDLSYDGNGNIHSKDIYEYTKRDSHGNWTIEMRTILKDKDGELVLTGKRKTTRKITYY